MTDCLMDSLQLWFQTEWFYFTVAPMQPNVYVHVELLQFGA